MNDLIRIEFWNGHLNKKGKLISTKHNPCLWTNIGSEDKPWRESYPEAIKVLDQWFEKEINDTDLLHGLRYVAYGLGKREYDDQEVVWWGNMTIKHRPKVVVEKGSTRYTIYFSYDSGWKAKMCEEAEFHWQIES